MRVAFNNLPTTTGHKARGIGSYARNLLEHLKKNPKVEVQEFFNISEVKNADLVHYPFFDLFQRSLPLVKKFPTIVTIHDVIPLIFPKFYPPGKKGQLNNIWQRIALKGVSAVITDSESSKKDIFKYLKVGLQKIFPIYLAPEERFKPIEDRKILDSVARKYQLPERFAVFVGDINWNKNLLNLTHACVEYGMDLVLIGKGFENRNNLEHPELRDYAEFLKKFADCKGIHILGYVSDGDVVAIVNLARVLLLPSFYEGFGLPILEAQACDTPVITCNIASMPEIAGNGALFVDPYNVKDMILALGSVEDNEIRGKLIEQGLENAAKFSWDKTADQTIKVYNQILKS